MALAVLQRDVEGLLGGRILDLVASDVTLLADDAGNLDQNLGGGHGDLSLVGGVRVANARQHVRNGIGNLH